MAIGTAERRHEIVQKALVEGKVDVADLARQYGVSDVTIRTDLNHLDQRGLLVRTHGGAMAGSRIIQELSISEKASEHLAVKRKLAEAARALVQPGDAIILDSGTTTAEIARLLSGIGRLMVMTNGLNVAQNLAIAEGVEVLMTGGKLRKTSLSFFGGHAEEALSRYNFDKLFLGVDGLDLQAGITTHFEYEAILNRRMCAAAKQVIAVTDSSKFNRSGVHRICAVEEIDILITDSGISAAFARTLEASGVQLIIVEP